MGKKLGRREVVTLRPLLIWLLGLTVLGVGCSKGSMRATRLAPTSLTTEDAITVIAYETESLSQISETADVPAKYSLDMAEEVLECIEEILEESHPTVRIVPPDKFREVAFPDLDAEDDMPVVLSWEHMARDPGFQARIAPLGLRYLISVVVEEGKGSSEFGLGPFSGGVVWDTWAKMKAEVVDLIHGRQAGTVRVEATGSSGAGLIVILPFYRPSFPESVACDELAEGVVKLLAGEKLPGEEGIWPAMAEESPEETESDQFEGTQPGDEEAEPAVKDEEDSLDY